MKYRIEKDSPQSAYLQLYHQLRGDIVSGVYPNGKKLPSKRLLAEQTGVSVITVEHAYAILCDEGYLEPRERSGYFVSYSAADCFPVAEPDSVRQLPSARDLADDFPFSVLAKTMRRVLSEYGESILVKSPNNGCTELRKAIAAYLARCRGINVAPSQIVIGSGAEYLYGLIVQLLGRERVFALENPSYEKIRRVYLANGVTCDMLRLGGDGIRTSELARTDASVLHVTPFHSFPSGITASAGKRSEYIRWAHSRGGYIVEDDFDSEFTLSSKAEDTLFSLEPKRSVLYLNTFSKTIAPSMRLGYMVLPESLTDAFEQSVGFYSCTVPVFEQYVLAELLSNGDFERHINRMRTYYRNKRDHLLQYLANCPAAKALQVEGENSGLHFLLHLTTEASDSQLREVALKAGLQIKFLSDYYHNRLSDNSHTMLMNYTGIEDARLYPALDKLFEALLPYLML